MVLSEYDRQWLQNLLIELFNWNLMDPFKFPVDPKRDHAENYYKIIKKPIDLSTMKKKLNNNEYQTVDEFSEDIRQIYNNSLTYNKKDSVITIIAGDLTKWYNDKLNAKGGNSEAEWKEKVNETIEKLHEHMKMDPTERMPPEYLD